MSVFLLHTGFVEMPVAADVQQVELVDQAACLQHFQRAIDGDAVQFGVFLLGHVVQAFGIQVLTGLVNQIEQDLTLPGKAHTALF